MRVMDSYRKGVATIDIAIHAEMAASRWTPYLTGSSRSRTVGMSSAVYATRPMGKSRGWLRRAHPRKRKGASRLWRRRVTDWYSAGTPRQRGFVPCTNGRKVHDPLQSPRRPDTRRLRCHREKQVHFRCGEGFAVATTRGPQRCIAGDNRACRRRHDVHFAVVLRRPACNGS